MPIIRKHQTLLDFSTQHCGTAESLLDVAFNNELSITDEPSPGTELKADELDLKVVSFFNKSVQDISTAIDDPPNEQSNKEGIGYWYINLDFKVS